MCTPHRAGVALNGPRVASTIFSLLSFAGDLDLVTADDRHHENTAPLGFQHLVQPQAWLWATFASSFTVTGWEEHRQVRVAAGEVRRAFFDPLIE